MPEMDRISVDKIYRNTDTVIGIQIFDEDKRIFSFDITPENISRVNSVLVTIGVVFGVPTQKPSATETIVMVSSKHSQYQMNVGSKKYIFHPFKGTAIFDFMDAEVFFQRLKLNEETFVLSGRLEELNQLRVMFEKALTLELSDQNLVPSQQYGVLQYLRTT